MQNIPKARLANLHNILVFLVANLTTSFGKTYDFGMIDI